MSRQGGFGDGEGLVLVFLIGFVSVVSDWCSLGLCDNACLRTVLKIPMFHTLRQIKH